MGMKMFMNKLLSYLKLGLGVLEEALDFWAWLEEALELLVLLEELDLVSFDEIDEEIDSVSFDELDSVSFDELGE